jgi:pteridine reductase
MNLKDKVIILTGAGRIGKTIAQELSSRGVKLAITYLGSPMDIEFEGKVSEVITIQADLSTNAGVLDVIHKTKEVYGRVDGLIHMAAIYQKTPWETLSEADWDKNINIIAKSTFLMTKAVGDEILKNEGELKGKIITVSDWSIFRSPYRDYLAYNTAKAAVVGLTLSLAKELAPSITVNNIAPGPTLKPPELTEEENQEVMSKTPLKRWGGSEEIAKAVLYLLEADFVTGVVLPVDGGRSIN